MAQWSATQRRLLTCGSMKKLATRRAGGPHEEGRASTNELKIMAGRANQVNAGCFSLGSVVKKMEYTRRGTQKKNRLTMKDTLSMIFVRLQRQKLKKRLERNSKFSLLSITLFIILQLYIYIYYTSIYMVKMKREKHWRRYMYDPDTPSKR